ncbi:MAG TPA: alpha-L-arabinofuranosidase C-terminal domain-containing protein [Capsulimonadaceae bacterium]|jgi:alpha-N-arabinofuranosidase
MSATQFIVLKDEPIATINPLLHGHFAEHLGELIYPGICVDPDCDIPNTAGIRNDVVDALKPLNIPVLRWPGGCFADTYHWRDGIGPVASRKKRVNVHWGMADEPNHFGTHEFMAFTRALGAEPYFAANLGSAPPSELRDWVEYANFPRDSALADERRANGADKPFGIRYWGVGNENWGCGGNMTPLHYADEFAKYQTFLFNYPDAPVTKVACGPNGYDWGWTRTFLGTLAERRQLGGVNGFAAHYYCGAAGTATEYSETQWLELLAKAAAVEGIVTGHRAIMDEFDPERKIGLYLDEWGAWHPVEKGKPRGGLYQQNTMRDACVAALTLDVFNNHADKLVMANIAQLINVLQSLLLVEGDQCIKTPTFHVFDLYQPHKGATAVRSVSTADILTTGEASAEHCKQCYTDRHFGGLRVVQGSASIGGSTLTATLVNSHPTNPIDIDIVVPGAALSSLTVTGLSTPDIHDHNTFADPNRIHLGAPTTVDGKGGTVRVTLPAASVTRLSGLLA